MKRIILIALCAILCGSLSAQIERNNSSMKKLAGEAKYVKVTSTQSLSRDGDIAWSCDFEDGCPSYNISSTADSETDWQIIQESDYPDEMFSGNRCYYLPMNFTGHAGCNDPNQQISETPAHWAFVDAGSDLYPSAPTINTSLTFAEIDLSGVSSPKVTFIQSWKVLNHSSEEIFVSTSTDNGATWTDHAVNTSDLDSYTYVNGVCEVLIPEAGNHSEVSIRFTYTCNNPAWHYGWQIDDIKIIETPANNISIVNGRMSMFGYLDYRNVPDEYWTNMTDPQERRDYAYQIYDPFAQSPRQNWITSAGYGAFMVEVENNGTNTISPNINIKVASPSGIIVYDKTITGNAITTNEIDTVDFGTIDEENMANSTIFFFDAENEEDIELGRYTVTYYAYVEGAEDATPENNTIVQYFDITDNNYSKSYYEPTASLCVTCYTSAASGDEYGTKLTYYYEPEQIMSADVYIDAATTVGSSVQAVLYEIDEEGEYIISRSSDIYEITDDMLNTWTNLPFLNEYYLNFNEGYQYKQVIVTAKALWDNESDKFYFGRSNVLTNIGHDSYEFLCEVEDGTWYYGSDDIAVTMHEGEGVNPTSAAENVSSNISMYPNPSNGIVNFANVENATIEVYNMMGQVVATVNNASENASIDLSNVANGNYVVRIVKDGTTTTSKLNIVR